MREERRAVRQDKSRPIVDDLSPSLTEQLARISLKTKLAEAIRYTLSHWNGLTRFIDDGRIEIGSNTVERSIRPIALNRKNALFAGSDAGARHWATIASLIETAKLNDVEPMAYIIDVITRASTVVQIAGSMTLCPGPMPRSPSQRPWPKNTAYDPMAPSTAWSNHAGRTTLDLNGSEQAMLQSLVGSGDFGGSGRMLMFSGTTRLSECTDLPGP